jgi:plasmid stabilization system protein ParE
MSAKNVEYHEGAKVDVKSAVAWYLRHSPKAALDFVEELNRATTTIGEAPDRGLWARMTPDGSCFGDFLFPSSTRSKSP